MIKKLAPFDSISTVKELDLPTTIFTAPCEVSMWTVYLGKRSDRRGCSLHPEAGRSQPDKPRHGGAGSCSLLWRCRGRLGWMELLFKYAALSLFKYFTVLWVNYSSSFFFFFSARSEGTHTGACCLMPGCWSWAGSQEFREPIRLIFLVLANILL